MAAKAKEAANIPAALPDVDAPTGKDVENNRKPVLVSNTKSTGGTKVGARAGPRQSINSTGTLDDEVSAAAAVRIAQLETLLTFEKQLRQIKSERELVFCLANELHKVVKTEQVFVLKRSRHRRSRMTIAAVSNLSTVDKNAPTVVRLERAFSKAAQQQSGPSGLVLFEVEIEAQSSQTSHNSDCVFLPLTNRKGEIFAGIVLIGGRQWFETNEAVLARVAEAAAHAWRALKPRSSKPVSRNLRKLILATGLIATAFLLAMPVPLTALAPVEIVAQSPQIVASPLDGVIEEVLVDANTQVQQGTPLLRYVDTTLSSSAAVAKKQFAVASAKLQTARQNSFGTGTGRRDIAVAVAEVDLAKAELDFANTQFSKTLVKAPADGIAVFNNRSDWQGRPVALGERVMEIANPESIQARINLGVSDAIVLKDHARVKLFLDANPLEPVNAEIVSAGYRATVAEGDQLAFLVIANVEEATSPNLRIGARGTAQIFGDEVTLGFFLFRRPIAKIRQWTGW